MDKKTRKWRCSACGYIHIGEAPPATCPRCSASYQEFMGIK